jgi:branched-chain amino acid aminotransferase
MPAPRVLTLEMTAAGPVHVHERASLADASTHLPHGAYTTLRTYGGRGVVRLDAHVRRLEESARSPEGPAILDHGAARRLITAALDSGRHSESRLRLRFSPPRLFVSVEAFVPLPPSAYEEGVACVTVSRVHRDQPRVKDTHFIETARRARRNLPEGIEEGLLLTDDGSILEGLSSNFFAVMDGVLHTEAERVLAGITRGLVIEVARAHGVVEPRAVRRDALHRVREAFITSASREILPVVRIDDVPVGDGKVGPITRRLMDAFADAVRRETEAL